MHPPPPFAPGDFVPILSSVAGVPSPVCMVSRGPGISAPPLMAGQPVVSGLAERAGLAANLSAQLAEHSGELIERF